MWNDTEVPLAYLITFRCYGTWLHGDERGSIDRVHNVYRSPRLPSNEPWQSYSKTLLRSEPTYLAAKRRAATESAIRETCSFRNWHLYAINVRTNHVHAVVGAGSAKPGTILHALKSNATRQMRENKCWEFEHSPWADKGSKRRLWNEQSITYAIDYVLNGQGDDLPDFDRF
jgi:REP element-mobilizing transposase RayT